MIMQMSERHESRGRAFQANIHGVTANCAIVVRLCWVCLAFMES